MSSNIVGKPNTVGTTAKAKSGAENFDIFRRCRDSGLSSTYLCNPLMFCHDARRKCHVSPALSPSQAREGEPAPDRDPGATAGGPFLSRQGPARLPGRRPSPDLSRERERRFCVSVRILHTVPPSRSVRPAAPNAANNAVGGGDAAASNAANIADGGVDAAAAGRPGKRDPVSRVSRAGAGAR